MRNKFLFFDSVIDKNKVCTSNMDRRCKRAKKILKTYKPSANELICEGKIFIDRET